MRRMVISWFGWDLQDFELIDDERLQEWINMLDILLALRGWQFQRLGNPIDLIFEANFCSITFKEFYDFQKEFNAINDEFGFRFSSVLWLKPDGEKATQDEACPWEVYIKGRVIAGDSIGRPQRHRRCKPDKKRILLSHKAPL